MGEIGIDLLESFKIDYFTAGVCDLRFELNTRFQV